MPPISPKPNTSATADADRAAHKAACNAALAIIRAAYERDPLQGRELDIKVDAWSKSLAELSPLEISNAVKAELGNRTSEFMPIPADIIARHKGIERQHWTDDDGKHHSENVVVANPQAYRPWNPDTRALPEGNGEGRQAWQELRKRLFTRGELKKGDARLQPSDEKSLSNALHDHCNMQCWRVAHEDWTAFGWRLLERYPVGLWTPELAKTEWAAWQAEEAAKVEADERK